MKMRFEQPTNGHVEEVDGAWFYTLIFGCFYLAYKGAWAAAVISFFAAMLTVGLSWLVMPVFADELIRKSFLSRGWKELPPDADAPVIKEKPKRSASQEAEHQRKLAAAARRTFGA